MVRLSLSLFSFFFRLVILGRCLWMNSGYIEGCQIQNMAAL